MVLERKVLVTNDHAVIQVWASRKVSQVGIG